MSDMSAPDGGDSGTSEPVDNGTETTATEPKQDDYQARIDQRFDDFGKTQREMLEQFEQRISERFQPEDDGYEEEELLGPDDDGYDEQEAQRWIQQQIDERVQERLTPIQQQQQLEQRNNAYAKLQDQFPQLQDAEFAKGIVEAAANEADDIGLDVNSPKFVRLIELHYKAHVADKSAAQETPAGQRREVQLESGGGAAPADRDEDIQDRVMRAAERLNPLI